MTERLQYYMHDEPDAFRFELSGSLSGKGAESVYHAWRTALSIIGARPLTVDITYIDDLDERGRSLLLLWHGHGARIVASSDESRALAELILGEPFPAPVAKAGLLDRVKAWLRPRVGVSAEISTRAEHRRRESAAPLDRNVGFAEVSSAAGLECRLPY
jgi:hypothetical protein